MLMFTLHTFEEFFHFCGGRIVTSTQQYPRHDYVAICLYGSVGILYFHDGRACPLGLARIPQILTIGTS